MDNLMFAPVTLVTTAAGLAAGTTTTYSASLVQYAIRSKGYSKAAVSNGATPTVDSNTGAAFVAQGINTSSVYVFGYDAAGTVRVMQGSVVPFGDNPAFNVVPDTIAPFGYLIVRVGPTAVAPWTFGASNQAGVTGVTYARQDLFGSVPDRPQAS